MTLDLVIDKRVMDCFTHGMHLESSEVFTLVGDFTIKKITNSLARLRSDNRVSFKRIGKGYVYWVDVVNIEPKPDVFVPNPIISEPVYRSKHNKAAAAIGGSWPWVCVIFIPWIVMIGFIVN